jgi:hypothetical protein
MDRKALSKRLEGLSSVFASETPIATDLMAMAHALDKMADDKFEGILASDIDADKDEAKDATSECSNDCKGKEDEAKEASDAGLYWNVEASDVILASLVKDVTGSTLTKEQTPDGSKKAEKPATLKEEQTPDISDSLESDIVKKSQGPVDKSASDKDEKAEEVEAAKVDDTEEVDASKDEDTEKAEEVDAAEKDTVQPTKPQPGDIDEDAAEAVAEVGSMESMAQNESKEAFVSEGVELNAPMIEASLDSKDVDDLGRLFA